jgi:hypothetical protein
VYVDWQGLFGGNVWGKRVQLATHSLQGDYTEENNNAFTYVEFFVIRSHIVYDGVGLPAATGDRIYRSIQ